MDCRGSVGGLQCNPSWRPSALPVRPARQGAGLAAGGGREARLLLDHFDTAVNGYHQVSIFRVTSADLRTTASNNSFIFYCPQSEVIVPVVRSAAPSRRPSVLGLAIVLAGL